MKILPYLFAAQLLAISLIAQTVDLSTMSVTKTVTVGTALPPTCSVGQLFFFAGAQPGNNLYGCTSSNIWTVLGNYTTTTTTGSGSPGPSPAYTSYPVDFTNLPSSIAVTAGSAIQFTNSSGSGTITATFAGNSGTLSGNVFTPNASIAPNTPVGGCELVPSDSIFASRVDNLPVNSQSTVWINQTVSVAGSPAGLGFQPSWSVNIYDNSAALTPATFAYTPYLNGTSWLFAPAPDRVRESGSLVHTTNVDHHLISLNHNNCTLYETYQDGQGSNGTSAQSGLTYRSTSESILTSAATGGSTDASGMPLTPLTLRLKDIQNGLTHAVRFTMCTGCISPNYVWPATTSTGAGPAGLSEPMGAMFRLKGSFDTTKFSIYAKNILEGLKKHPMILADIGSMMAIQADDDVSQDANAMAALIEIGSAHINQTNFEIVDPSSLMASAASYRVDPSNTLEPVASFGQISVSDSNGHSATIPVQVTPVLVGAQDAHIIVSAGQNYQAAYWVNGVTSQSVNWTVKSGPGSITSSGLYTPPSTIAAPTAVVLQGLSGNDANTAALIHGWVVPSGDIRIDVGSANAYTDSNGKIWMADTLGFTTGASFQDNDWYPASKWAGVTDAALYQTFIHSYGDDITYGPFIVPNGTYAVAFGFAQDECIGSYNPASVFDNSLDHSPLVIEANGTQSVFDPAAGQNKTCLVPSTGTITATVTNNVLKVAVRSAMSTLNPNVQSQPYLSALQIVKQN